MKSKPILWLVAAVLLCALAFGLGYGGWLDQLRQLVKGSSTMVPAVAPSIAILPFKTGNRNDSHAYLAEGIPQELIAALSRLEYLKVIGRTSSLQFKDSPKNAQEVGASLGADHLIEGQFTTSADHLHVSVQLLRSSDGAVEWSDNYDRPMQGLIAVNADIATTIARKLGIEGVRDNAMILQTAPPSVPPGRDIAPYLALLEGDYDASLDSEAAMRSAIASYDEAIHLDASFAVAYARLSIAWSTLSAKWLNDAEVATANARALSAAQSALRLTPDLSEAHEALATVEFYTAFDRAEAGAELRKAMELAPRETEPKVHLGQWLAARGQIQEGLALLQEALATDPLNIEDYLRTGMVLSGLGRYDEAEAIAHKALVLQPSAPRLHLLLTDIALARGKVDVALDEASHETDAYWREYALALVAQKQGAAGAADAALSHFIARHSLDDASQIAVLYAARKDPDQMFIWLNRALTERDAGVFWWLLEQPFLVGYRNDPRYGALCVRLGIDPSGLSA